KTPYDSTTHFVHAVGVPATFKIGSKEFVNDGFCQLYVDESGGDTYDIGVVVLTGEGSQRFLPADCSSDTLVFVGGNSYAIGTAAYQYAAVKIPTFYRLRHRVCEIGVIHRISGVGAKIFDGIACTFQEVHQFGFIGKTRVVSADGDGECCIHG